MDRVHRVWCCRMTSVDTFTLLPPANFFALAHRAVALPAVLPQGRGGHCLRRAFCVKPGAGPLVWKFPVKSCDRLARGATQKEPG